jgi:hypothetical protein
MISESMGVSSSTARCSSRTPSMAVIKYCTVSATLIASPRSSFSTFLLLLLLVLVCVCEKRVVVVVVVVVVLVLVVDGIYIYRYTYIHICIHIYIYTHTYTWMGLITVAGTPRRSRRSMARGQSM